MAAITAELALEISKFQASLKQAQDSLRSFKSKTESTGAGLGSSLTSGLSEAVGGIGPMLATGITSFSGSNGCLMTCGISASRLLAPTINVLPSAGACSRAWMPMPPPAPGLFSMITGCPMSADNCCPTRRATMSIVPPGGAGTISLSGFSPRAQALKAMVKPASTATSTATTSKGERLAARI